MFRPVLFQIVLSAAVAFALGVWLRGDSRKATPVATTHAAARGDLRPPPIALPAPDMARLLDAAPAGRRQLLATLLPSAGAVDLASIAEWLPRDDEPSWELLLLRWNETAPRAMGAFVLAHEDLYSRSTAIMLLAESAPDLISLDKDSGNFSRWCHDLDALYATNMPLALRIRLNAKTVAGAGPLPEHIRRMGHRAFIEWVNEHERENPRLMEEWRESGFTDWAEADAAAVMAFTASLKGEALRNALTAALPALAAQDAAKTLTWMKSLPPDAIADDARAAVFAQLARQDLEAALAGIRETWADPAKQRELARELVAALAEDGNPAALRVFRELPWSARDMTDAKKVFGPGSDSLSTLFAKWAERDPEAALAGLKDIPPRLHDASFTGVIFETWARHAPQEALAAIPRLFAGDPAQQSRLRGGVLSDWSANDPEAALRFIQAPANATRRLEDESNFCDALERISLTEGWPWLLRLSPDSAGWTGQTHAYLMARDQPALAAREFPGVPPEWAAPVQCGSLRARVERDPLQAPAAAAQLTQLAPKLQPQWAGQCLEEVAQHWAQQDANAAAAWVDQWQGDLRESAIEGLLRGAAEKEAMPAADRFSWALTMSAENKEAAERKAGHLSSCLELWAKDDPAAARAAVKSAILPEEQKAVLLSRLPPP